MTSTGKLSRNLILVGAKIQCMRAEKDFPSGHAFIDGQASGFVRISVKAT